MHDLRVELDAVELALGVLEGGDRRRARARDDARARGRRRDRVAVRHPRGLLFGQAGEERAFVHAHLGLAELGDSCSVDAAAQVLGHQLHAVADTERGDPELVDPRVDPGRAFRVDRSRAAGEHERERVAPPDVFGAHAVADQFRVDAALAYAPRDQLRVLAPEVDDEDGAFIPRRLADGEGDDLAH